MTLIFSGLGRYGRLGNQLWQIAAGIGIAEARGEVIRFPRWEYAPYFSVPDEYFVDRAELNGREVHELALDIWRSERVFLQSYLLFASVEERIRSFFQPSALAEALLAEDSSAGLPSSPTVALHVRRGDLINQTNFAPPVSLKYYQTAAALRPDDVIVVFSDDIGWCQANLPMALPGRQIVFREGVPRPGFDNADEYRGAAVLDWVDLQLMARCTHHIIPNSSFAWWGAFLSSNPSPIYPSNWNGVTPVRSPTGRMMFPPGWREVPNELKDMDSRTRSNAYIRSVNRLGHSDPLKWAYAPLRISQAMLADPMNTLKFVGGKLRGLPAVLAGQQRRDG